MKPPSIFHSLERFDWAVLTCILILAILCAIVLWRGEQTPLEVTHFSWEGKKIGVQDSHFTLSFNRPVNQTSVEQNLITNPPLPGKVSWTRGKLFYTLTELPIYGTKYELQLQGATKAYSDKTIEPFISVINTHDRAFAYIGVQGEERGKLILCNILQPNPKTIELKKVILTPADLVVTNFEIYPQGDRILFSAFDRSKGNEGLSQQQLYTITTGLNFENSEEVENVGRIKLVLDAKDYNNIKFDLSDNGKTLIVQRVNQRNTADAGLWVMSDTGTIRPLGIQANDFRVAPNGETLAISQSQGVVVTPLDANSGTPQFFPGYEKVVGFSKDGSQKLLVKNNPDFSRSLVLVNKEGTGQELFKSNNPIMGCLFEPRQEKTLYCLKTDLVQREEEKFQEEPFLSIIDLKTYKDIPFLALPNYRDVQMTMSPDGVALLFDQVVTTPLQMNNDLVTQQGQTIADGRLWLLTLPEVVTEKTLPSIIPEELNPGFKPLWLP